MSCHFTIPPVKSLRLIAGERAKELRQVLEITVRVDLEELLNSGKYPATKSWYGSCYHPMPMYLAKLSIASEITECHGVESVPEGSNAKSPAFDYVNTGDSYAATLVRIRGNYRISSWGDIVERGNYA